MATNKHANKADLATLRVTTKYVITKEIKTLLLPAKNNATKLRKSKKNDPPEKKLANNILTGGFIPIYASPKGLNINKKTWIEIINKQLRTRNNINKNTTADKTQWPQRDPN